MEASIEAFELIFFLVGLSIMATVAAIAIYRRCFRSRDDVVETSAHVVRNEQRMGNNSVIYHPVIEFETENGIKHEYTSKIGTTPPRVRKGTYVTVYYLRSNPRKHQIRAGAVVYVLTTIVLLFGVIFSSFGLYIMLAKFGLF